MSKKMIYIDERSKAAVELNLYDSEHNLLDPNFTSFRFVYRDKRRSRYVVEHIVATETTPEYFKNCYMKDNRLFIRFQDTDFATGRLLRELWLAEKVEPEKGEGFCCDEMKCVLVEPSNIVITSCIPSKDCCHHKPYHHHHEHCIIGVEKVVLPCIEYMGEIVHYNLVLSVFKTGANELIHPQLFAYDKALQVTEVLSTSNSKDIHVRINGMDYNKNTLVGVQIPARTEIEILDMDINTGYSNGNFNIKLQNI